METNGVYIRLTVSPPAGDVTVVMPDMKSAPVDWLTHTAAWRALSFEGAPECLYPSAWEMTGSSALDELRVTLVKEPGPIFLIHTPGQGAIWLCVAPNGCDVGILVVSNQQCTGFVTADGARLGWVIGEVS